MSQPKFIVIGESWLEIPFADSTAQGSRPGGEFLQIAKELASADRPVIFISETGDDAPGAIIADDLASAGVDFSFSDRYSGKTSILLRFPDGAMRYDMPNPGEGFDITWPRVENDDIVIFGGYMALEERIHERLWAFLTNCKEHNATLIYIPDVDDRRISRITREMPRIFENLELADMVITLPADLEILYGYEDPARAFKNNISFYCGKVASITSAGSGFEIWRPDAETCTSDSPSRAVAEILTSKK